MCFRFRTYNKFKEEKWEDNNEQIGSDEVGVGDFFLGFYVVASYLSKEDMSLVEEASEDLEF